MRFSLLAVLATALTVHAAPTTNEVNQFLQSINVNPSLISSADKEARGVALTCSVLAHYPGSNSSRVTTERDGSIYLQQAQSQWSATAYKHPSCIYTPSTPEEVSIAVRVATFSNTQFAVRSGGHSPLSGWANIDNKLLISLAGITDLEYDQTSETARVGFGNRWQDVYAYLSQFNRLVIGGRQGSVGIGLATGGGLSHLSNEYGWPSQNVLSYNIVLANATIVTASATENPDLYFAIKAGSNNFGIVTHITQRTVPLGKVWGGRILYSGNSSKAFMAAVAEYQQSGQFDNKTAILPYLGLNNDTIICTLAYMDEVERPDAFKPFYDIPAVQDETQMYDNFTALATIEVPSVVPRWTYMTTTILLDNQTYVDTIDIVSQSNAAIKQITGGSLVIMAQPISKSMVDASRAIGGDPMNVTPAAQMWFTLNIGWSLAADDEKVYQILTDAMARVEEYTKAHQVHDPFIFLNDAFSSQNPFAGYGEESYSRLRAASSAYDPRGVFQRLVPGGFKL
ncbi:bifunctional solanapyrone synthase [Aspergillus avenaceus]|uniref:Bifunctional solanapyrone synthase n=1 Tax=Aspergillus avenaceus TaxID=36643 RepID=A0A5N6TZP5_ASPAV|nr:bifunctional solanapyrone synthase [Aspergillus avenaceus]